MPWWFWVISHIWVMCIAGMFVGFLLEEQFKDEPMFFKVILIFLCLIAPATITVAMIGAWFEHNWDKIKDKWFWKEMRKLKDRWLFRKLKQVIKYFASYKARKKDFKEMDDNEDEWSAERLGIKLK